MSAAARRAHRVDEGQRQAHSVLEQRLRFDEAAGDRAGRFEARDHREDGERRGGAGRDGRDREDLPPEPTRRATRPSTAVHQRARGPGSAAPMVASRSTKGMESSTTTVVGDVWLNGLLPAIRETRAKLRGSARRAARAGRDFARGDGDRDPGQAARTAPCARAPPRCARRASRKVARASASPSGGRALEARGRRRGAERRRLTRVLGAQHRRAQGDPGRRRERGRLAVVAARHEPAQEEARAGDVQAGVELHGRASVGARRDLRRLTCPG